MGAQSSRKERSFLLETGLTSAERDCITGTTPDALIILCGGTGTLTETAFAEIVGRPHLLMASRGHLLRKSREHGKAGDGKLEAFFNEASSVYVNLTGRCFSVADLESALDRSLDHCPDYSEGSEDAAVDEAIRLGSAATCGCETSFPGLPQDPRSTRQIFNEIFTRIEQ